MKAVMIPNAPPAVWTDPLPVNSATKRRRKVMSRKKKREQRAIEDRREATKKICRVFGGRCVIVSLRVVRLCSYTTARERRRKEEVKIRTKVTMNQAAK
jgi:hypothetical protein